ncbi:MAG: leucine--tRNA ligase [Chlorobiaceae bacterium]|nr:leucine--tRNA ligase [Chlorobiaceae bacterium]MBA4309920.1 leucine--tRNA ligase [Chlorobiaceae bacterium]
MRYPFSEIETKWQINWEQNKVHKTDFSNTEKKLYTLVMFIYPSGAKLHCGHWYNYGPTDTWARFQKLKGYNVFEPMGYDAFGLPAENYAIKTGIHPKDSTLKNIEDIRQQLKKIGCMYDWDAELMTCVPEYYKWNQWLFLQLYKKGLAYRKNAPVNWCTSCQTVLANEQVLNNGTCERCNAAVIQKNLTQWFFKITNYAEELLDGLDKINWPEKTKLMQRNWIGKSIGAEVTFKIADAEDQIKVFTTRPDTLFGATYMVLAPEHPLVEKITTKEFKDKVEAYKDSIKSMSEIERSSTVKQKTGVATGAFAVNPANGKKIPIWIADYVLMTYGTGAIMAVPGQDERDWEFATQFNLPIIRTVQPPENFSDNAFLGDGLAINSDFLNGLYVDDAKKKMIDWLEEKKIGKSTINYRLRDWLISRQRYWGTPIPIVHCEDCGEVPIAEDQLPVELPYEIEFKPTGESPLASNQKFINTTCPTCGKNAKRDPDTMDTFVDSAWYYLRFLDPKNEKMFDKNLSDNWTPVDMYVGGAEHATMHLLYSRFIHKFLRDLGLVNSDEPFKTLVHQGTITNNGAKMSKSKGNVVNPDEFTVKVGNDVFRLYLMFMGPYEQGGDWSDKGISGTERFVARVYDLCCNYKNIYNEINTPNKFELEDLSSIEKSVYRKVNQSIAKVETELEHFRFNTAIAALMECLNELTKNLVNCRKELQSYSLERFIVSLAPLAPHLSEECWEIIGKKISIYHKPLWVDCDEKALIEESVSIAIQVGGKMRGTVDVPMNSSEDDVKSAVIADDKIAKHLEGKTIVKQIFVLNKIMNFIVK